MINVIYDIFIDVYRVKISVVWMFILVGLSYLSGYMSGRISSIDDKN